MPAAHLWLLACLLRPLPRRRVRLILIGLGLLPLLFVAVYYLFALKLDPLSGAWYLLMLVTGHSVALPISLLACLLMGAACGAVRDRLARAGRGSARRPASGRRCTGPARTRGRARSGGTRSALGR